MSNPNQGQNQNQSQGQSPVMGPQEADAYKKLSQAWADIERQHLGSSVTDDPRVKTAFGAGVDWMAAFQFAMTVQKILTDPKTQAMLNVIAPQLAQKLIEIENQTGLFLTQARALLDGILGGVTPTTTTTLAPGVQPVIRMGIMSGQPGSVEGSPPVSGGAPEDEEDDDLGQVEEEDESDPDADLEASEDMTNEGAPDEGEEEDEEEDEGDQPAEGQVRSLQTGGPLQPGENPNPADVVEPIPGPPPVPKPDQASAPSEEEPPPSEEESQAEGPPPGEGTSPPQEESPQAESSSGGKA